jgi:hypothetical protein
MRLGSQGVYGNYGLICLVGIILLNYFGWVFSLQSRELGVFLALSYFLALAFTLYQLRDVWPAIVYIGCAGLLILYSGTNGWDARSLWLFHAKRIYFDHNLYSQLDGYAPWSHNDYPTLYPAFAATLAGAVGLWNEVFPKSTSLFFLSPPLLLIASIFREKGGVCLFIICMMFVSKDLLINGYIDALLALYISAIVLVLRCEILTNKNLKISSIFLLNSCLIIILPLLKNEGLVITGCLFICLMITKSRINKIYFLSFFASVLIYFFTWKLPVLNSGVTGNPFIEGFIGRLIDRAFLSNDLLFIVKKIFSAIWYWLILILSVLYLNRFNRVDVRLIGGFVLLYLIIIIFVYLSTPYDLVWHLETSLDRVLMPIIFVIFTYVALIFSEKIKYLKRVI